MQNIRLDKAQAGIRLLGEISVTSDMLMLTTLMAGSEELKSLLMKVKEENEKYGLKLSIKKTKIMASGPLTSWQVDGKTMETMTDYFVGLQISLQMVTAALKLKNAYSWAEKLWSTSVQFSSVPQSYPTLCDSMNHSMPGLPVHHQLLESTQTHVHWVGDAIQPSHPLSSPSPLAPNPSLH